MKEIILIKNGELVLKGLNRRTFEDILIKNIKNRLKSYTAPPFRLMREHHFLCYLTKQSMKDTIFMQ